jgi:hypothetical protein
MINRISLQAIISGKKFNPETLSLPSSIRVFNKQLIGDEVSIGRYKGSLSSEGILIIDGTIEEIVQFILSEILSKFSKKQIELNLCILVEYEGECNFELSFDEIEKMSLLKVPFGITCYND